MELGADDGPAQIKTFLIADIRGYTLFTQERGDEAAAKLAGKFADVVRDTVEPRGGRLLELRGDEALAFFDSARQAMRTAVELQVRCVEETVADPELPLTVGIGIDAGEAVPVEGGYRGGALNLAARLCGQARAGESLASREAVHLARRVDGVRYADRGALHLKGLAEPVQVMRVIPEEGDPAEQLAPFVPARGGARGGPTAALVREHKAAALTVAIALVAAVVVPLIVAHREGEIAMIAEDAVGVIDPDTGEITEAIELEGRPGALAAGEGAVWVTQPDRGIVVRIDPATKSVVDTIQVGADPTAIAAEGGSVWVANSAGSTVSRISPQTNSVVQTLAARGGPTGIAVGGDALWIANAIDDTVSRVDPEEAKLVGSIEVGDRPSGIDAGDDGVWVANFGSGTVSRIDPNRGFEVSTVDVGNGPRGVARGWGAIWVANHLDDTVSRIDPAANAVVATIRVGDGPGSVVVSGGTVWVSNELDGTVSKIEPGSNAAETFGLGAQTGGAAWVGGSLWVGVRAEEEAHRGGTLTVLVDYTADSVDPAIAYSNATWNILSLTNDGLVSFKRAAGLDGSTLVPDLARYLPTPTQGGRTYTFQLRSGIRYSDGATVRPQDFRRAIERVFTAGSPRADLYLGIVGAEACLRRPAPCDLSEGIVADDDANTVTFRLEAPDPEFLAKLAHSFAFAVPPDTPDREASGEPVPATGPYMIASYSPERVELVRNPRFQQWSRSAQPDGFPDHIVWRFGVGADQAVDEVLAGRADLMFGPPPPNRVEDLIANHAGQVFSFPSAGTYYAVLNLVSPPFSDLRARQAVNYAVDRERVVELMAGGQARPTCQVLPPNVPQYEPYCPYTSDPGGAGIWTAPDLGRAQRLVAASGTAGTRVGVWAQRNDVRGSAPEIGDYLVELLDSLGYRPKLTVVGDVLRYLERRGITHPERHVHILPRGWTADFPGDSSFIPALFSCGAPDNVNSFCDPEIDAMMEDARGLETTDPSAAGELWAEIERRIVDQAPWIPLANPLDVHFVSERVGNYHAHPHWLVLVSQLWVQ